jgi:fatty acid desaturase
MTLFPILEVILFIEGFFIFDKSPIYAILLIMASGIAMCFSLHITYHYHVHFKLKSKFENRLIDFLYSILTGLPFHFYYLLHTNHHVYDNEVEDFTTTIKRNNGNIIAKNIFTYSLFWFRGSRKPIQMMKSGIKENYFTEDMRAKTKIELLVILLFEVLLGVYCWKLLLLYFALVYFGWMFISLHNYGQHLPNKTGIDIGNSFYNKLYNYIFVNNGLHYEHHKFPREVYWKLKHEKDKNMNNKLPHLLDGFRFLLFDYNK